MKTNCWLVLVMMLATSVVAQVNTNALPEIPAPATVSTSAPAVAETPAVVAPVKKAPVVHKKKIVKKISEPTVALVAGSATVASQNLNVRGQAGLKGEVIGHLKGGDTVTVISQLNLDKHAADEPAQWAKISLPAGTKVWVNSRFVDATNKIVSVKKLNLRAGPGENYSVLGILEKGASISELGAKGDWTQIETPTNAFAFVAAMFLKQEAAPVVEPTNLPPTVVETPVVATPPPTASTVTEAPAIVSEPPVAAVAETNTTASVAAPAVVDTNVVAAVTDTNPPPPRVVTHEGYVRSSVSIVAPTAYELYDWDSGNAINYLYSTSTNLDLGRYHNFRIIVTGEEGISPRWAATPVLTIQKIYVLDTNLPAIENRVASPRGSEQTIRGSKPQQRR
jgi:hypothetical protein